MKFTAHYPVEQYGFLEAEFETDDLNIAAHNYQQIAEVFKPKPINALTEKEMDKLIQNVLEGNGVHTDNIEKMSPQQSKEYNRLKRALARLDYKTREEE